jgi:bacteriorhodopsin
VAGEYRQVFYVRFVEWAICTPLLLTNLLLTARVDWVTIALTILADEIMVVTGLIGALVPSTYKWGYFVFATLAFFFVAYNVGWVGTFAPAFLPDQVTHPFHLEHFCPFLCLKGDILALQSCPDKVSNVLRHYFSGC